MPIENTSLKLVIPSLINEDNNGAFYEIKYRDSSFKNYANLQSLNDIMDGSITNALVIGSSEYEQVTLVQKWLYDSDVAKKNDKIVAFSAIRAEMQGKGMFESNMQELSRNIEGIKNATSEQNGIDDFNLILYIDLENLLDYDVKGSRSKVMKCLKKYMKLRNNPVIATIPTRVYQERVYNDIPLNRMFHKVFTDFD